MSTFSYSSGRPTDEELTARILDTTRTVLIRDGYASLKIEHVVREAGCGKSAVYRRYPNKAELVAAAVLDVVWSGETADTGSVREDLLIHTKQNQATQSYSEGRAVGRVLFDPDVFPLIWDRFLAGRRDAGIHILERAVARGELPADAALDIILDTIAGLTLYRQTVKGIRLTSEDYRGVIDALIRTPPLQSTPRT